MKKSSLVLIATIASTTFVFADSRSDAQALKSEADSFHTQILEKRKAVESESHQGRIEILKQADECIKAAKTNEEYKECEQKERQAREQLRDKIKAEKQAIRQSVGTEIDNLKAKREKIRQERMAEHNRTRNSAPH
jgi:GTPase involved in cell partitioning and DNA repair